MLKWFAGFVLFFAIQGQAYVGAVSTATAEAGRASVEPTDSPFLNPAGITFLKGYYFTTGYDTSETSTQTHGENFALTLTDNLPETVVPTSLAFAQTKADFSSEESVSRDFRLSFANFITPKFAFGVGLRYKDDQLPAERYNQGNASIGTLYAPNADLGFAAVFENLMGTNSSIPEELRLNPNMSLGVSYIYRRFMRTRFDVVSGANDSFARPILEAGLESYMNRWAVIRLGIQRRNEEKATAYSAGMGFSGPKFSIQYAYLTSPDQDALTRHSIDMAIPVW